MSWKNQDQVITLFKELSIENDSLTKQVYVLNERLKKLQTDYDSLESGYFLILGSESYRISVMLIKLIKTFRLEIMAKRFYNRLFKRLIKLVENRL